MRGRGGGGFRGGPRGGGFAPGPRYDGPGNMMQGPPGAGFAPGFHGPMFGGGPGHGHQGVFTSRGGGPGLRPRGGGFGGRGRGGNSHGQQRFNNRPQQGNNVREVSFVVLIGCVNLNDYEVDF